MMNDHTYKSILLYKLMKVIFDKFIKNPTIKNSFLEQFVANLSPLEKF